MHPPLSVSATRTTIYRSVVNRRAIGSVPFAIQPPLVTSFTLNCRAVGTVSLPIHPPLICTIRLFNSRAVHAVSLTIHPPLLITVALLNGRAIHTVPLVFNPPLLVTIGMLHSRTIAAVALSSNQPLLDPKTVEPIFCMNGWSVVAVILSLNNPVFVSIFVIDKRRAISPMQNAVPLPNLNATRKLKRRTTSAVNDLVPQVLYVIGSRIRHGKVVDRIEKSGHKLVFLVGRLQRRTGQ